MSGPGRERAVSDDSSCQCADVGGGYATGSEASTDDRLVPYESSYDAQTIDTIATGISMLSGPALAATSPTNNLKATSVGSAAHQAGRCKPCAFYHKQGCQNGSSCIFCHQCPPHEKQRRKRLRRRMLREHFAPSQDASHKRSDVSSWSYAGDSRSYGQSFSPVAMNTKPCAGAQAHQFAPRDRGLVLAPCPPTSPSLLSTAPHPNTACRFVQDEPPYSSPTNNMRYQSGPVQYALVPVPVPVQQLPHPSQQQQQMGGAVGMAVACPPWQMDSGSPCVYADGYCDASNMQWANGSGASYMCVVSPNNNGSSCGEHDIIQVPAY